MGHWEFLDMIALADCAMDVEGSSLDDLFATAARAVAEVMVDPATVVITHERRVSLSAPSLDLLLYDWLSELLYLKDSEQMVFTEAEVLVTPASPCRLEGRLRGGVIDRERTELRADAKAVTFHQFVLEPRGDGWHARLVIDI